MSLVFLVGALALAAAGCSMRGSDYQYVRSRSTGTYLRLPKTWAVEDAKLAADSQFGRRFDGVKIQDEGSILTSESPTGLVDVRPLPPEERDVVSYEYLRNVVFPIDQAVQAEEAALLENRTIEDGDFRGHKLVFQVMTDDGPATVAQITYVDPKTTRLHLLVVGCLDTCWNENESAIDDVIESLTVKES